LLIGQYIEAQNLQHLEYGTSSAKSLMLSFHIKSTKTGTYCLSVTAPDGSRNIIKEYTVSASNTWEKKTIIIPGDTSGTINNDNGQGLWLQWVLIAGTDRHKAADSWSGTTSDIATSNQVNACDSTSNNIYLAGVQLEVGTEATPFEHRSFGDELLSCKRYYESSNRSITGTATTDRLAYLNYTCYTTSAAYCTYFYEVEKRAIPTITHGSSNWRIYQNSAQISSGGAGGTDGIGHRNFSLTISGPTFDVSEAGMCDYRVHDGIKIDAEL
jgi:hypothetical protein